MVSVIDTMRIIGFLDQVSTVLALVLTAAILKKQLSIFSTRGVEVR